MKARASATLLLLALASLGAVYALRGRGIPPSSPAGPPSTPPLRAEGRVTAYPGEDVTLGTDLGGTLLPGLAEEGAAIRRGQVLARIDARRDEAARREAEARLREAEADIAFLRKEAARQASLHREGVASRQALEQTQTQLDLALARRGAAEATRDRLEVTLSRLALAAPFDGVVLSRLAQPGETVPPGAQVLRVARLDRTRVEAEVDEFDLSRVRLGAPAQVHAEGLEGSWPGRIEEVPRHVVGRRLKPQDPARPSDTRVLLVKVALEGANPLKLGQRVELEFPQ
ncbi:MAG: efflux RND transporter periplasmic adaptor subunit [Acidobacteria bacterium]|nr:efflux RND transporter periplasmic adaptor subunit [Acidobacteriota bacterium]